MVEKEAKQEAATMSLDQVKDFVTTLVRELKRDEKAEAAAVQAEALRKQERESSERDRANTAAVQAACPHMRENGSYCIAWMGFADNVPRGVCQHCMVWIIPGHPQYEQLLKESTFGYILTPPRQGL